MIGSTGDARRKLRFSLIVVLALTVGLVFVACGDQGEPPGFLPSTDGSVQASCTDQDQDGFGTGCGSGRDCDDADPSVGNECYRCAVPRPDCSCEEEGTRAPCGEVQSEVGGQKTCGLGETVCTNGTWSECIINNSVYLLPDGDPKLRSQALGAPDTCDSPCDPYCKQWPDTPGGIDGEQDGVVITDAGVGLGQSSGTLPPSACTGGEAGGCAHHLCETGAALGAGCDSVGVTHCIAEGGACSDQVPCCHGLSCDDGSCEVPNAGGRVTLFFEDFSQENENGWSLDGEWEIDNARSSDDHSYGYGDPRHDASPTSDDNVAGVDVGGNVNRDRHGYHYLTSPVIDASTEGSVYLSAQRWLNSDYAPYMRNRIQVYDGDQWRTIWSTGGSPGVRDRSWELIQYDITEYKNSALRVRFGFEIDRNDVHRVSGWNLDDIEIWANAPVVSCAPEGGSCENGGACCNSALCADGVCASPESCTAKVCEARPSCCSEEWDIHCVDLVQSECGSECAVNQDAECVLCYQDALDHDGDGYSFAEGDCKDCDANINPGAYDFEGNGIDEDCDGNIDAPPDACDATLSFSSSDAENYARAMDLCQFTGENAQGAARTWGVISAELVRADGSACNDSLQRAIMQRFGHNNIPLSGGRMAAFSSGTARDRNDSGYQNPSGQYNSYDADTYAEPPAGFPKNASGCPNGTAAFDSCGLRLKLRAPTNAQSFAYSFNFFTSEYAEWVCSSYNDSYIALYEGSANPLTDKNISFDESGNPVSVNVGFFSIPSNPSQTSHPVLDGTGYDGYCNNTQYDYPSNGVCGGATGWLTTTAPVVGGEEIELFFSIWDTGDHAWDSLVLLDAFRWFESPATIETLPTPEAPEQEYQPGDFVRTYDAHEACSPENKAFWGHWSWTSVTPTDSNVEFYVTAANTEAELETAPEKPLRFSNPPGPSSLAGLPAVARAGSPDTQNGSAVVDETLQQTGLPRHARFVRVRSRLNPSSDKQSAPTLAAWNLEISCQPNQ